MTPLRLPPVGGGYHTLVGEKHGTPISPHFRRFTAYFSRKILVYS
jgi:hypothetical protein